MQNTAYQSPALLREIHQGTTVVQHRCLQMTLQTKPPPLSFSNLQHESAVSVLSILAQLHTKIHISPTKPVALQGTPYQSGRY